MTTTPTRETTVSDALSLNNIVVGYGAADHAVGGLSLKVPKGEVISVLGPNGGGKTSTMRAISGLLGVHRGRIIKGQVSLFGTDITNARPSARVRAGLAQCLEGRVVFPALSVSDNLATGAHVRRYSRSQMNDAREEVLTLLPRLGDLLKRQAGYLSGGEQQMLAIARALMSGPRLLLLDEPSLGLAPRIVEQVRDIILEINSQGTSILLVEQNARMALSISSYAYLLENGGLFAEGTPAELEADNGIVNAYLGGQTGMTTTSPQGASS